MKALQILLLIVLLAGCASDLTPRRTMLVKATPQERAEQANAIYAAYFEESLRLNPLRATFLGQKRYTDQLPNFLSLDFRQRQQAMHSNFLEQIREVDPEGFSPTDDLSYELFVYQRTRSLFGFDFPGHLMPINQFRNFGNTMASLGSGRGSQPFETVADYDNWLKRVHGFVVLMDQAADNMEAGIKAGIVQPRILMEKVLPQLAAHVVEYPEQSVFWGPVKALPDSFSAQDKTRLEEDYRRTIVNVIVPAYQRLHQYIETRYLPKCRATVGLSALPGGEAWYAFLVEQYTTTALTPKQIHEIGLEEVSRIHGAMREVIAQVGFDGDLAAFFQFTRDDPQFVFESREAMLQAYRALRNRVDAATPRLFSIQPKADYEVRAVEAYRERSAAGGSYQRASADGGRPGIFYVNTFDLAARPTWAVESLFLHEAAPGHHFQLSIQQELGTLPDFRRFSGFTAYAEGWGLYAETLGKELGLYQDPYQYFGALNAELWRAIRLVVDTGIHAQGWSRERVLEYMFENSAVAEARAIAEAERFMAIPGQALAYKIGQLKISELRARAESALGSAFDVREFHNRVLENGSLPLAILESKIDRWLADQGTAPTGH